MAESRTIVFQKLPENLAEMKALPEASLKDPFGVAALAVAALCEYPKNKDASLEMLNFLRGPQPLSPYDKQFLADRFRDADYVPRSYFAGALPQNNYQPAMPYSVTVSENPYSRAEFAQGYLTLWLQSGGADSPRQVKLRTKPSTGEWFLWEQMLLGGIRIPAADDPWA